MAAQVQPSLLEKELVDIFMDNLQSSYFERMIGSASSDFSYLVAVGERIENELKSRKTQGASNSHTGENESSRDSKGEEEDETDAIMETHQASQAPSPLTYYQYSYASVVQCQQPLLPGPQYQQRWPRPHNQQAWNSNNHH